MTPATCRLVAITLAGLPAVLGVLHRFRVRSPAGFLLWLPKVLAGSLSLYLALAGVAGAALGLAYRVPHSGWIALAGALGAAVNLTQAIRSGGARGDFATAFGPDWAENIPVGLRSGLPSRLWSWRLASTPRPVWSRNVPLWTVQSAVAEPRPLLCDLWEPPPGTSRTGLAFIYFHGGAWHFLDKDFRTRPLFRHLTGQGHVVMDVAYRLSPEADVAGMVDDFRKAISWMKSNGSRFGVDRRLIVIGGGSAGAHLALLAGYQAQEASLAGIVSFYAPTDLRACHAHTGVRLFEALGRFLSPRSRGHAEGALERILGAMQSRLGDFRVLTTGVDGLIGNTLGPGAVSGLAAAPVAGPDPWELASPAAQVRPGLPPTLLLQGDHDSLVPVAATQSLYHRLLATGNPVVYVEYPQTEHAFDLFLPRLSPSAQNAFYHLDRFLGLLVGSMARTSK